jgi:hypothetical protein
VWSNPNRAPGSPAPLPPGLLGRAAGFSARPSGSGGGGGGHRRTNSDQSSPAGVGRGGGGGGLWGGGGSAGNLAAATPSGSEASHPYATPRPALVGHEMVGFGSGGVMSPPPGSRGAGGGGGGAGGGGGGAGTAARWGLLKVLFGSGGDSGMDAR